MPKKNLLKLAPGEVHEYELITSREEAEASYQGYPWFSWAGLKKDVLWSWGGPETCRESFAQDVNNLMGGRNFMSYKRTIFVAGVSCQTIAMARVHGWENRVIRLMNAIEDDLGWLRTRAYQVQLNPPYKRHNYLIGVIGSRRWMKSPPMISFYTLLIRNLFRDTYKCPDKRIKKLESVFLHMLRAAKSPRSSFPDTQRLLEVLPRAAAFLRAYPDLFEKRKISYYYDKYEGAHGIQRFLRDWPNK